LFEKDVLFSVPKLSPPHPKKRPTIDLASRPCCCDSIAGVILQSPIMSGGCVLLGPTAGGMARPFDIFTNYAKIGRINKPVAIMHGTVDEVYTHHMSMIERTEDQLRKKKEIEYREKEEEKERHPTPILTNLNVLTLLFLIYQTTSPPSNNISPPSIQVVPLSNGRRLRDLCAQPYQPFWIDGHGHNDMPPQLCDDYCFKFISSLAAPPMEHHEDLEEMFRRCREAAQCSIVSDTEGQKSCTIS
jgi:hypothetical protein